MGAAAVGGPDFENCTVGATAAGEPFLSLLVLTCFRFSVYENRIVVVAALGGAFSSHTFLPDFENCIMGEAVPGGPFLSHLS